MANVSNFYRHLNQYLHVSFVLNYIFKMFMYIIYITNQKSNMINYCVITFIKIQKVLFSPVGNWKTSYFFEGLYLQIMKS